MENGKRMSFWDLIQEKAILIPEIQRDYIQYRETSQVKRNRKNLLRELCKALETQEPMRLNFIYGTECEKDFIPIDGQQRLTTLWLLHMYIFANAGNVENLGITANKIKYATRQTTQDFLNAFSDNVTRMPGMLKKADIKIGERIKNMLWYVFSWNRDPSVRSFLTMLNEMEEIFAGSDFDSMSLRLMGPVCPITFMLMTLENDLQAGNMYIRMNSTGKPLTRFESFKAELLETLHDTDVSLWTRISQHIDDEWSSYVWNSCRNEDIEEHAIEADSLFRQTIHSVLMNDIYAEDSISLPENNKGQETVTEDSYLDDYQEKLGSKEALCRSLSRLADLMDLLCQTETAGDAFRQHFCEDGGNRLSSYPSRVLLYGMTRFAEDSKQMDENEKNQRFAEWWRILRNSVMNAKIDRSEALRKALRYLKEYPHSSGIADYLVKYDDYVLAEKIHTFGRQDGDGFSGASITLWEDILKQKLIRQSEKWKAAVEKAESIPYFNAEIGFMLKLAGIDIVDPSKASISCFEKIVDFCEKVFCNQGNDFENYALHRALLCYGDYSRMISDYSPKKASGTDYLKAFCYNDKAHHKEDWRGMLRTEHGLDVFKKLTKAYLKSGSNEPAAFLNRVIAEWDGKPIKTDLDQTLREKLIREPGIFKYISWRFRIWYHQGEWRLLPVADRRRYIPYDLFVQAIALYRKDYEAYCKGDNYGEEYRTFMSHIQEGTSNQSPELKKN